MLLALYVAAAINEPSRGWPLAGLVVLALLVAWLWPGALARREHAVAWLSVCALGALVLALLVRPAAPWIHDRSWNVFGTAQPATAFQWDQLYGPINWSRSTETMFDVSAPAATLWTVTTLDRFDGIRFLRSDDPPSDGSAGTSVTVERLRFTVQGLHSRLLARAGRPIAVEVNSVTASGARITPDGTLAAVGAPLEPGDTYAMTTAVSDATAARLRRAPARVPPGLRPFTQFELPAPAQSGLRSVDLVADARAGAGAARTVGPLPSWRSPARGAAVAEVLASPYARMFRLARHIAAPAHNAFDAAARLAAFLRRNYAYDEQPPARAYPLEAFLFQDGIGYCQQFSGAMALMLRMDGIPSRVAVGFTPGTYDASLPGYRVTALDAHAWVEVYFSGLGWSTFDPTPPRTEATLTVSDAASRAVTAANLAVGSTATPAAAALFGHRNGTPSGPAPGRARPSATPATLVAGAVLLALAALLALTLLVRGTVRLRRGVDDRGDVAVSELGRTLSGLGYGAPAGLTLVGLERRLQTTHGAAAARYVGRLAARRYGPPGGPSPTPHDRRALRRALVSHGGPWIRLRALWLMPPALALRPRPPGAPGAALSAPRGSRRG